MDVYFSVLCVFVFRILQFDFHSKFTEAECERPYHGQNKLLTDYIFTDLYSFDESFAGDQSVRESTKLYPTLGRISGAKSYISRKTYT